MLQNFTKTKMGFQATFYTFYQLKCSIYGPKLVRIDNNNNDVHNIANNDSNSNTKTSIYHSIIK